jgi:tetratricopeptide (TPR) repeat protein
VRKCGYFLLHDMQIEPMHMRIWALVLACALSTAALADPYVPTSPNEVLLELGSVVQRVTDSRAQLQSDISKADAVTAAKLAQEFIDLGRAQNDERYFGYASASLQPWNNAPSAPIELAVLRADIAQHQHRFNDAHKILDDVLVRDALNARARLMRAALLMTQGQPRLAQRDCVQLLGLRETFAATLCLAQTASLTGRLASSYDLVSTLLQRSAIDSSVQYIWGLGIAGEMAERTGDLQAAEKWLRKAIELSPTDWVSRLQLCDVLLQARRPGEVMTLLEPAPASEPVLLRRALAARMQNKSAASATLVAWQAAVAQSAQLGIRLHLRELARGELELLGKPQQALATALQNWEIQREPSDARILAQAARAAGDQATLTKLAQWQRDLKLEDAGLSL